MAAKSGDLCERCGRGRLNVASSQSRGEYQTRYLRCQCCGATAKSVVPAEYIRRRTLPTQ